jgi:hypothetical protein
MVNDFESVGFRLVDEHLGARQHEFPDY